MAMTATERVRAVRERRREPRRALHARIADAIENTSDIAYLFKHALVQDAAYGTMDALTSIVFGHDLCVRRYALLEEQTGRSQTVEHRSHKTPPNAARSLCCFRTSSARQRSPPA